MKTDQVYLFIPLLHIHEANLAIGWLTGMGGFVEFGQLVRFQGGGVFIVFGLAPDVVLASTVDDIVL